MFFKSILVPYDDSDHAKGALHTALGMAADDPEATVHVVTIVTTGAFSSRIFENGAFTDSDGFDYAGEFEDATSALVLRAREELADVIEAARDDAACKIVSNAVLATSPVEGISNYVVSNGIDLIVMGRRGLGALRGMLGSVSYGVLRSIDVPVLTVK